MATTFADLEARFRGIESRTRRNEEDITAIIETVVETRDTVRDLARTVDRLFAAVTVLLDHQGLEVPPETGGDESDTD